MAETQIDPHFGAELKVCSILSFRLGTDINGHLTDIWSNRIHSSPLTHGYVFRRRFLSRP
jgi:hypothetical protein